MSFQRRSFCRQEGLKGLPDAFDGDDFFPRLGVDKDVIFAAGIPFFEGALGPEHERGRAHGGGEVGGAALGREQKRRRVPAARRVRAGPAFRWRRCAWSPCTRRSRGPFADRQARRPRPMAKSVVPRMRRIRAMKSSSRNLSRTVLLKLISMKRRGGREGRLAPEFPRRIPGRNRARAGSSRR